MVPRPSIIPVNIDLAVVMVWYVKIDRIVMFVEMVWMVWIV
jgi:hypothetical protein